MVELAALTAELGQIRQRGDAIEEQKTGLIAIAAPIRSLDGKVEAALTVSDPVFRLTATAPPGLTDFVVAAGMKTSWWLSAGSTGRCGPIGPARLIFPRKSRDSSISLSW